MYLGLGPHRFGGAFFIILAFSGGSDEVFK